MVTCRRYRLFSRNDLWASIGIALKHQDMAVVSSAAWTAVVVTAMLMIIGYYERQSGSDPALAR